MDRRVLFVSYLFPPVGGAGVQRVAKFVKYLPASGWTPTVLTVSNPSVPVLDPSLLDDVPAAARMVRARTWGPGYAAKRTIAANSNGAIKESGVRGWPRRALRRAANFVLQPDAQVLWWPAAVRAGTRLLRATPHHAIVASGPPFSTLLVGASISRRTGVPLVLDYRDEWDLSNRYWENKQFDRVSLALQRKLQERVARQARLMIATSRPSAAALEAIRDRSGSLARVACLYNGFDPDDFSHLPEHDAPADRYRLVYVGTLWNLTTVRPLVEAVARLAQRRPELASRLELVFAGRRTPAEQQILSRLDGLPCRLTRLDYVDHDQATRLMRSAHALCLLLADLPGAERVVPAKIFEYMAAGRTILAIAPPGEVHDLLKDHPRAACVSPDNIPQLCEQLEIELRRYEQGEARAPMPVAVDDSPYSRKRQAGELAELLDKTIGWEAVDAPAAQPAWAAVGA